MLMMMISVNVLGVAAFSEDLSLRDGEVRG